jgi:nucleoside-diphosphate-sugar epimerase
MLVTGAAGFLGSHLCDRLLACGAEVHAVSRSDPPAGHAALRWWRGTFDDPAEVDHLLRAVRPSVVFHLGGHVTASPDIAHVVPTFTSLLASTVHLLVRAPEHGVRRIVLVGSSTEPCGTAVPGSPYAAAKWCASAYARMAHALYGTPVVVTRPFMTYGPRQKADKVIPYVVTSLLAGRAPRLTSGALAADWVYVDDVIDGLLKAATVREPPGQELDLGTGRLTTLRDVVTTIGDLVESPIAPHFGALPDRPREEPRVAEIDRTWALLGWRATTALATGLERTIEWHRRALPGGA